MEIVSTQPRRVKVYTLEGEKWVDRGTGYCTGETKGGRFFIVRDENDPDQVLLKASIEGSTQYQRQQDTLIVWTDGEGNDYALSFQEPEGCLSLCNFLVSLQRTSEPNISLVAVVSNGGDGGSDVIEVIAGPVAKPELPNDDNLAEVLEKLTEGAKSPKFREMLWESIQNDGYLDRLLETFDRNEKAHNLANLYYLSDIAKTLFFYNDSSIVERFLEKRMLRGVVGMLEYDVEHPNMKTNHREYLDEKAPAKEVVTVEDPEIRQLICKTFGLQFLKDVVLARIIDDSTCNCITNLMRANEERILDYFCDDSENGFLSRTLGLFDEDTPSADATSERRCEAIKSLHQYVLAAKRSQSTTRANFYRALIDRGLFSAIKYALKEGNREKHSSSAEDCKVLATEIMVTIIEHDVYLFRGDDSQANSAVLDTALVEVLTDILLDDSNMGLKTQAFEALKVILDPASMSDAPESLCSSPSTPPADGRAETFLKSFYEKCAPKLFAPLMKMAAEETDPKAISRREYVTYASLCSLCALVAREHERSSSRRFIVDNDLLMGVAALMKKGFPYQVRLVALGCIKQILLLDDDDYTDYLIDNDTLRQFMLLLKDTNKFNNLVNSGCLNVLELVREHDGYRNWDSIRRYLCGQYRTILSENSLGRMLVGIAADVTGEDSTTGIDADGEGNGDAEEYEEDEEDEEDEDEEDEEEEEPFEMTSPDPPVEDEANTSLDRKRVGADEEGGNKKKRELVAESPVTVAPV